MLNVLKQVSKLKDNRQSLSPEDDSKLTDALVALEPWLADAHNVPLPGGERLTSGQPLTEVARRESLRPDLSWPHRSADRRLDL